MNPSEAPTAMSTGVAQISGRRSTAAAIMPIPYTQAPRRNTRRTAGSLS